MIPIERCLYRGSILVFLVSAAACGKTPSRTDAAQGADAARDLACTGQACADLGVDVPSNRPDTATDVLDLPDSARDLPVDPSFDRPDASRDTADRPVDVTANPLDAVPDEVDGARDLASDLPSEGLRDASDASVDRADLDAASDRGPSPDTSSSLDVTACPSSTKPDCVEGFWNSKDAGACSEAAVAATCVGGAWVCPANALPKSACTEHKCPSALPSGACSPGESYTCFGWVYNFVQVTCSCPSGTWSCPL